MQRYTPRRLILWLVRIYGPIDLPSLILMAAWNGIRFRDANTYICEHVRNRVIRWVGPEGKERLDVTPAGRLLCPAAGDGKAFHFEVVDEIVVEPKPERPIAKATRWLWGQR